MQVVRTKELVLILTASVSTSVLMLVEAHAISAREPASVMSRHDAIEDAGIVFSSIPFGVSAELAVGQTDNAFQTPSTVSGDESGFVNFKARAALNQSYTVYEFNLAGQAELREFELSQAKQVQSFGGIGDVTWKGLEGTEISLGAHHLSSNISRDSVGFITGLEEPVQLATSGLALSMRHQLPGDISLTVVGNKSETDYDDIVRVGGSVTDQDFRDFDKQSVTARLEKRFGFGTSYVAVEKATFDYSVEGGGTALDRDSDLTGYKIGAVFGENAPLELLVELGIKDRQFDFFKAANRKEEVGQVVITGRLNRLTDVKVRAARDFLSSPLPDSLSAIRDVLSVQLDHSLTDRIVLTARGQHIEDVTIDDPRGDKFNSLEFGAGYKITGNMTINATYVHFNRAITNFTREQIDENEFSLSLRWQR